MGFRIILIICLCAPIILSAQGKFLLVGGGSEKDTPWSWSNMPYSWAVDQSQNKKVAIISYSESSDPEWLPAYFTKLGADDAVNFIVSSRELADDEQLNAQIDAYDVVFFKGGDQFRYFELYDGTLLEETIRGIFNRGGVIAGTSAGMAILSTPFFTAENGSFYPDEALADARSEKVQLGSEFLGFNPGFIFDTHFIERGRHARLLSFVGNSFLNNGTAPIGIGVDDQTAFCIDENGRAIVYGTGAVSLMSLKEYSDEDERPAGGAKLKQLVHGHEINLLTLETDNTHTINSQPAEFTGEGRYQVFLAGSSEINENTGWLTASLNSISRASVVAPENSALARSYEDLIRNAGISVRIITVDVKDECERATDINFLSGSDAILWIDNNWNNLSDFLNTDPAGQHLSVLKNRDGIRHFFLGDNADFAGSRFALNRTSDELNAYYGELEFTEGLSLISDMMIVADAYDPSSTAYYENNTSSILFAVMAYSIRYGLWINERTYAHIYPEENTRKMDVSGNYSALLATNNGTRATAASEPVNEPGDSRQVVGFDELDLDMVNSSTVLQGNPVMSDIQTEFVAEPVASISAEVQSNGLLLRWEYEGIPQPTHFNVYAGEVSEENRVLSVEGNDRSVLLEEWMAGIYLVTTVTASGESCPVFVQADNVTSVEAAEAMFWVYPNPANDGFLRISGIQAGIPSQFGIIDLQGKIITQQNLVPGTSEINIDDIPAGIYLVEVRTGEKVFKQKIIIGRSGH